MKKELGQYFTTNSNYIIGNLLSTIPQNSEIVDPFAGDWDLLNIFDNNFKKIGYDIQPKNNQTIKQDTLYNPPNYENKWIITNPPYLARNKNKDKTLYNKYNLNDFYKIALKTIIGCNGGIIIIPLNFFSDEKSKKIRNEFLSKYEIQKINIFEEQVFKDTSYTVCSFSFIKKDNDKQIINPLFFPSKKVKEFELHSKYNYTIGGSFLNEMNKYKNNNFKRLTKDRTPNSNLYLRATDTGGLDGKIKLMIDEPFYGKNSDRTFATIILPEEYKDIDQELICKEFNNFLNKKREEYSSLFLTNYRNSSSLYARKRISFELAYKILNYVITHL